jgi:hypothetical protein
MRNLYILVTLVLIVRCADANAASIVWPAATFGRDADIYGIGSTLVEETSGCAGVAMEVLTPFISPTLTVYMEMVTLAVGHFWFETAFNAPVNAATVGSATPFAENFGLGGWQPIDLNINHVFYLGFWLDADGNGTPSASTDIYGWAALLWDGTELTLVDSAAETTGAGIYAGTYDAIPEPTSAGLLLVGIAAALLRRKARRRGASGAHP